MRARNIKPGFYKNEDLAECSVWARLIFPGLWMMADRDGRLEDRPKRIKAELLPFDAVEVEPLLEELAERGFIRRYERDGLKIIQVVNFAKHQAPHHTEKPSALPPPAESDEALDSPVKTEAIQEHSRSDPLLKTGGLQERSRSEGVWKRGSLPPDSLNHESLNPECVVVDARAREEAVEGVAAPARAWPPPTASPPAADPIHARAVELAVLLRRQGAALQPSDPRVRSWAERGITDEEALLALQTAQRQRQAQGSRQPINAGYLDAILRAQAGSRALPTATRRSIHDERAHVLAVLSGRRRDDGSGRVIDITPAVQPPPLARGVGGAALCAPVGPLRRAAG